MYQGLSNILQHQLNASYSLGSVKSNKFIIPSSEHPYKLVVIFVSNLMSVTYCSKLSLNYDLCFIFLKSQNIILLPHPAARMCSVLSTQLNFPGISTLWVFVTFKGVDRLVRTDVKQPEGTVMAGCDDDSLFVFDGGYFALVYDGTLVDWFACIKIQLAVLE